ncbi:MAG: 23S rRNA (guanosine(2251)-2'-O)-methyltransferase RlmB [Mollicutes bacterium PWAP]|nr:23S rRNA (guanosine(2251)-2'-O)-methyltransferase RlmB [Mollicutes bacterium PWAP]
MNKSNVKKTYSKINKNINSKSCNNDEKQKYNKKSIKNNDIMIVGRNSVRDFIKYNPNKIKSVFVKDKKKLKNMETKKIAIKEISDYELNIMSDENHQGFIAILKEYSYYSIEKILTDKPTKVLILDKITDVHNFGAIIRSANAFGYKHIVISKNNSVSVNQTVAKISSGGLVDTNIIMVNSLKDIIVKLKENNFWIYSTALETKSVELEKASFNFPLAIVMGSENKGVSKTILNMSDQIIHIDMKGTVQSLNVSVATGIVLQKTIKYEKNPKTK